jgi:hypothetical protein
VLESAGFLLGEDDHLTSSLCKSFEHLAPASWSISRFGWSLVVDGLALRDARPAGGPIRIGSSAPIFDLTSGSVGNARAKV